MDLKYKGYDFVDWIRLVQDRDRYRIRVCTVINPRVQQKSEHSLPGEPLLTSKQRLVYKELKDTSATSHFRITVAQNAGCTAEECFSSPSY
jgi:hypothetical protein